MKVNCNYTTTLDDKNKSIWASVTSAYNYISPSHTDEDGFLSCLLISYVPAGNGTKKYPLEIEVALYFYFPE